METNILVKTDKLTNEEWLRWRQKGLGGSDIAPILGISKWSSAIDIWLSKTNQKHDEVVENEAMTWGKILEPVIRDRFREVTGKKVYREVPDKFEYWLGRFIIKDEIEEEEEL